LASVEVLSEVAPQAKKSVNERIGNAGNCRYQGEERCALLHAQKYAAGTDFIIARDGRIAAVYLSFDKLP